MRVSNDQVTAFFEEGLQGNLVRFLRTRLILPQDAEDLSQEVYLRLLRIKDYSNIRNHKAYALQVAAHVAYEWNQLARNRLPHSGSSLDSLADYREPWQAAEVRQQIEVLNRAMECLAPKCRAVILLHRRDGLTYAEIATRLGISVSMVRKYLAQGLAKCQMALHQTPRKTP